MSDGFLGWLGDALGINAGNATTAAASKNTKLINGLETQVGGLIDSGADTTNGYLTQANDLTSLGPGGAGLYGDALGTGGAEGSARALDAFRGSNPAYQFQLDQGLQALDRSNAARGGFQSGGAGLDEMKFSQGMADQSFQQWLDNLGTGIDRNRSTLGDLATASQGQTGQRIGLAGDIGSARMGANNQAASGAEANQGWLGNLIGTAAGVAGAAGGLGWQPFGAKPAAPAAPSYSFGGYGSGW